MYKNNKEKISGYLVSIVWLAVAAILYYKRVFYVSAVVLSLSVILFILNYKNSRITSIMNKLTLKVSVFIGIISTKIVLTFVYYIAITPIGLFKQAGALLGKKNDVAAGLTYWKQIDKNSGFYEKQF